MNILIIGFGDIGKEVGQRLVKQGHQVMALKRSVDAYHDSIQADITKPLSCRKDFDYVLYIVTPSSRDEIGYKAVFDEGLHNALSYFSKSVFLFISSSVVYGQEDGSWVDETSATTKESMRAKVLVAAEDAVLSAHDKSVVIRFSGIYGRGGKHLLQRLQRGEAIQYAPPYYTNRIHKEDCIGVICFIMIEMFKGGLKERVFNATDSHPLPLYEVASLTAKAAKIPAAQKKFLEKNSSQNKRLSNKRLLALGYRFIYPAFSTTHLR